MQLLSILSLFFVLTAQAEFRVVSYNIRNFDYDERSHVSTNKAHLIQQIKNMNPHLMAVQEINKGHVFNTMLNNNFDARYKLALTRCGGAHDQKLGFVFDQTKLELLSFKEDSRTVNVGHAYQEVCGHGSRPLAIGVFKRKDTQETFIAISVHLKSGGRPKNIEKRFKQHKVIQNVIQEYKAKGIDNFILMGDFNSTEYNNKKSSAHEKFKQSVNRMNGIDLSKQISCTSYWWGGIDDNTQYPSLLDHIIVSKNLVKGVSPQAQSFGHCAKLKCQITAERDMGVSFDEVSDHCPQLATLK
ncbi:MAG: hypothetical protein CME62_03715 [Halobacteriovoraceae bacterium]|nr:hypothetical protein [Halobacteriovoraceae bacterium]|tara:strand:- start:9186 stop:10085 length:900 start_codon:yes stop_codon:yes gene_type:complete